MSVTNVISQIEYPKSTPALITLIFSFWISIFTFLGQIPQLTNTGTLFGLLFLTTIVVSWIGFTVGISWIGSLQEKISIGSSSWISNQIKRINDLKEFKELRDNRIAEFLFGISTLMIALLFSTKGTELIKSLTEIEIPNLDPLVAYLISLGLFVIGILLILKSLRDTKKQKPVILCLIWLNNLRHLQGEERDNILKVTDPFRDSQDWKSLEIELSTRILIPTLDTLKPYLKRIQNLKQTLNNRSQLELPEAARCFPGFFDIITNSPKAGSNWENYRDIAQSEIIYFRTPLKLKGLDLDKILLGSNKELIRKTSGVQGEIDDFNSKILSEAIMFIREIDSLLLNMISNLFVFGWSEIPKDPVELIVDPPSRRIPTNIGVLKLNNTHELILLSSSIGTWLLSDKKKSIFTIRHQNNVFVGEISLENYSEVLSKNLDKNWEDLERANVIENHWRSRYEEHLEFLLRSVSGSKRLHSTNFLVQKIKELENEFSNLGSIGNQVSRFKEIRGRLILDIIDLLDSSEEKITIYFKDDVLNHFLSEKERKELIEV